MNTRSTPCLDVADIMARLAAGDPAALGDLGTIAAPVLAARLRQRVFDLGGRLTPGDLDGLVTDALLEIARSAGSWRADGGALPWNWARLRVDAVAVAFVGQRATSLDDHDLEAAAPPPTVGRDGDSRAALRSLAAERREAAVLDAALQRVANERDALVWLDAHRDSPAVAAALHGVRGDHARQISRRVGLRLRHLAAADPAFADLAALPAIAA